MDLYIQRYIVLSATTNYAIRALAYIASLDGDHNADSFEISEAVDVPRNFLLKILNRLRGAGILKALRGIGGGFWFARPPKTVTLYDIVEIFEDMEMLAGCVMGVPHCSASDPCPIHEEWVEVHQRFVGFLKNTTFESFRGQRMTGHFPLREGEMSEPGDIGKENSDD
jgi:Rrf2 family protein